MIEKTTLLQFLNTAGGRPLSLKELIRDLNIKGDDRPIFKKLIRELLTTGELIEVRKDRIGLPERLGLFVGDLSVHRDGFGFVTPKSGGQPDIYVSRADLREAMHNDLVVVRMKSNRGGKLNEGQIVRILQRGQSRIIGTYEDHGHYGFVLPEDPRLPFKLYIDAAHALHARPNQIVMAQIITYNTEARRPPEGEIVEILGFPHTPGIDEKMVIHAHNLPHEFPAVVLEEVDRIAAAIPAEEIRQRLDLREQIVFTIDGETAQDFDDAVSIERLENGHYQLGVHIADVSYYVQEGSELDQEAYRRGTSVYFPDRAIPMLPAHLSSDICCLREGHDRLTLSAVMEFDPTAKMVEYDLRPSIIRSKARFTYTIVRQILKDQDETLRREYAAFVPTLEVMQDLSELLLQRRNQRGSLDFDLPEPELILDVQGRIENIVRAERNLAHRLIEEFMIAANETVAAHLTWLQIPSIYRVHEPPDEAKLSHLEDFLRPMGLRLQSGAHLHSKDVQRLLKRVQGRPIEHVVNFLTLRAMKQAIYATRNIGHFGLASTHYTHFTSPIRRYPDLMVHRILRATWRTETLDPTELEDTPTRLEEIAKHSSVRERVAMEAERDILEIKKLRFMQDKVGDVFRGVISGVAPFGLFVELQEYFVEGLIHISNLHDDYYAYREETHTLVGEHSRHTYQIGDLVTVQIARVDVARRHMDLVLTKA